MLKQKLVATHRDRCSPGPPTHDSIEDAVHVLSDPTTTTDRRISNNAHRRAVCGIGSVNRVLSFEVVQFLDIVVLEAIDPGIASDDELSVALEKVYPPSKGYVVTGPLLKAHL